MYKKNDILLGRDGYKRKVLAVVDNLYALSGINKYTVCRDWYTPEELDVRGYTLDSSEWVPELNKLYWYVNLDLNMQKTSEGIWDNHDVDIKRKQLNLVFKTKELAEKRLAEVRTFLKK